MMRRKRVIAVSALLGMSLLCGSAAPAVLLGTTVSLLCAETAWAVEAGTYLVTVTPSYTDPETGTIEDPGNNEAIGQGMTQKLCGPQGLLEVDASGNMYLTVRYYLSQFVSDVSFEERSGGSYSSCSYQRMQTKEPVSGASNLDDKYGYTDYRIPIRSLDSVFRGKAYIEPMGRNVVYFFQASGPVAGSGDFVTSVRTSAPAETEAGITETAGAAEEGLGTDWSGGDGFQEPEEAWENTEAGRRTDTETGREADEAVSSRVRSGEGSAINGSGDADAPVTGIPPKPSAAGNAGGGSRTAGADPVSREAEDYHLQTEYDLSKVPIREARKLTEPILEEAEGITLTVGELPAAEERARDTASSHRKNNNKTLMLVLLAISAVLLVRFAMAFLPARRGSGDAHLPDDQESPETDGKITESEQDEAERRRNRK